MSFFYDDLFLGVVNAAQNSKKFNICRGTRLSEHRTSDGTIIGMLLFVGVACCLTLAAADVAQLRQLAEKKRFFELREVLKQSPPNHPETLFYRAVIEARFCDETAAIENLRKFLATHPNPGLERKVYEELAAALVRMDRYGEAAQAWAEALRLTPLKEDERADTENRRALYESLRDVPPQAIQFADETQIQAKRNPLGTWDVPVEVNGHPAEWIFDTGANMATVIQSEAAKLGLSTRETSTYVKGSTGKKNSLRLAVAGDLRFGSVHVRNVVFPCLPTNRST